MSRINELTEQLAGKTANEKQTIEPQELTKAQASRVRRHVKLYYFRAFKFCFFDFLKHNEFGVEACLISCGAKDETLRKKLYKNTESIFTHETSQYRYDCRKQAQENIKGKWLQKKGKFVRKHLLTQTNIFNRAAFFVRGKTTVI